MWVAPQVPRAQRVEPQAAAAGAGKYHEDAAQASHPVGEGPVRGDLGEELGEDRDDVGGALVGLAEVSRRFAGCLIELLELGQDSGGQLDIVMADQGEALLDVAVIFLREVS